MQWVEADSISSFDSRKLLTHEMLIAAHTSITVQHVIPKSTFSVWNESKLPVRPWARQQPCTNLPASAVGQQLGFGWYGDTTDYQES